MIPETTLSSPLTDHLYAPFIVSLAQPKNAPFVPGKKSYGYYLAQSLKRASGVEWAYEGIFAHSARSTDLLLHHVPEEWDLSDVRQVLDDSLGDVRKIESALNQGITALSGHTTDKTPAITRSYDWTCTDEVVRAYASALYWTQVLTDSIHRGKRQKWARGLDYWTNRQLTIINIEGRWVTLSHDATLMLRDLSISTFLTKWYTHIRSDLMPVGESFRKFQRWSFKLIRHLGECAYEVIKGVECFSKLRLIEVSETILNVDSQITPMLEKYRKKQQGFGLSQEVDGIDALWEILQSIDDPDHLGEVFSFLKLVGHPYINPIDGCESSRKLAHAERRMSPIALKQLEWSFCHLYTRGYLIKKQKWPPLKFEVPAGRRSILQELHDANHPSLPLGLGLYDASDWEFTTFESHVEFDYGSDILSLISDSALSYKRSEVDNSWPGRLPFRPKRATTSTRVLEELLKRPKLDMKEICDRVSNRDIPFDWKIVTVCPKEREMKLEPRMFAMMVLEMRSFFVLTEKNMAEGIFSFIPEQTMTSSSVALTERFLELTKNSVSASSVTVQLEIDFSRWNLNFDRRSVNPIGKRYDQIFGTHRLYDFIHELYEECLVVLRHSSFIPDLQKRTGGVISDQPGIWNGHPTGMEGIFQKGWTAITICIIAAALWQYGLKFDVTGQGDNQVVFIRIPRKEGQTDEEFRDRVRSLTARVKKSIASFARDVGQEVKPEECTEATSFTSYGKVLWFQGRVLSTSIKSISRMIPSTTSDSPSAFQMISNVSAAGSASTDRAPDTHYAFLFTKLIENLHIRRELRRSILHEDRFAVSLGGILTQEHLLHWPLLLNIIPLNLGGLPVSTAAEFLHRGHPDPLMSSLSSIKLLQSIPVVRRYLDLLDSGLVLEEQSQVDKVGLIMDPFSVPLRRPAPPASRVCSRLRTTLIGITKNRDLRDMVRRDKHNREPFMKDVLDMTPFYPKVAHDIYKCSIFGVCDGFAKRFTNTRTLFSISRRQEMDLASLSLEFDRSFMVETFKWMALVYKVQRSSIDWTGSMSCYHLAVKMRNRWGIPDLQGVTVMNPLDFGLIIRLPEDEVILTQAQRDKIPIVAAMSLTSTSKECRTDRGPVQPYLGSTTSDKSVAKWMRPVDSSPPQRDAIKLLQIRHMLTLPGSELYNFLTECAQSRCSHPVDELTLFVREKIGGVVAHRYQMSDADNGSYLNSTTTWGSHVSISSNLSGSLGELDRPVSYQGIYHVLTTLMKWLYWEDEKVAPFGLALIVPEHDGLPIVADHIVDKTSRSLKTFPTSPDLFYARSKIVKVSPRAHTSARVSQPIVKPTDQQATIEDAITTIFLSALTGRRRVVRKMGYNRGVIVQSKLIDLPECRLISLHQYIESLSRASLLYIAYRWIVSVHKELDPMSHLSSLVTEAAWMLVPSAFGTLNECGDASSVWSHRAYASVGSEQSLRWWVEKTVRRALEIVTTRWSPATFLSGTGSVSQGMLVTICNSLLTSCLIDQKQIPAAKILAKICHKVSRTDDEPGKVRLLLELTVMVDLSRIFSFSAVSAEEVCRSLRGKAPALSQVQPRITYSLPQLHIRSCGCIGTGAPLHLETSRVTLDSYDRMQSLRKRPLLDVSDAHLRWAPVCPQLEDGSSVLVIGIGAGGILRCIPPGCSVVGIDLAEGLQPLGQDFTSYTPPVYHPGFSMHPLSWALGGNVLNPLVRKALLKETSAGLYKSILIDIEGVSAYDRLLLRHELARSGSEVWVKVAVSTEERQCLLDSFFSFARNGDLIWDTEVDLGYDLILGKGPSPLGLLQAVRQSTHEHLVPRLPVASLSGGKEEKEESFHLAQWTLYNSVIYTPGSQPKEAYLLPRPGQISSDRWIHVCHLIDFGFCEYEGLPAPRYILRSLLCILQF